MTITPAASAVWGSLRLLTTLTFVGAVPMAATAGSPEQPGDLADRLRRGPGVTNHPVHVVPSAAVTIPTGWPLDLDGSLTCLTCHQALPSLYGGTGAYLRDFDEERRAPTEFCLKCHRSADRSSAATIHWMAVRFAHVKSDAERVGHRSGPLDAESKRCLGCHDGVTASESRVGTVSNRGGGSLGDPQRNHPVGVRYRRRSRGRSNVQLRPMSMLPASVRLPGGQVSCVSCHDLYAPQRGYLTVPIKRSALCFACHQM